MRKKYQQLYIYQQTPESIYKVNFRSINRIGKHAVGVEMILKHNLCIFHFTTTFTLLFFQEARTDVVLISRICFCTHVVDKFIFLIDQSPIFHMALKHSCVFFYFHKVIQVPRHYSVSTYQKIFINLRSVNICIDYRFLTNESDINIL